MVREHGAIPERNLLIKQGAAFQLTVGVVDESGLALSLAGYTAFMQIRSERGAGDPPLVSLSTGDDLTINGSAVLVDIPGVDTAAYDDWTDGVYDLFIVDGTGEPFCVLQGQIRVDHRVTVLA